MSGDTEEVLIRAKIKKGGEQTNIATVDSATADPNDTDTATTIVKKRKPHTSAPGVLGRVPLR